MLNEFFINLVNCVYRSLLLLFLNNSVKYLIIIMWLIPYKYAKTWVVVTIITIITKYINYVYITLYNE